MREINPNVVVDKLEPLERQRSEQDDVGAREFNPTAVYTLRKRVRDAVSQQATNVAIDARFLDELLQASDFAMKHGYQSRFKL